MSSHDDVPMVPLQEDHHSTDDVKVIVNSGAEEKDSIPLGEQCMEAACSKRAVAECAIKDCKKRLCIDHKHQLAYAHDHRILCSIHHSRAQFQYRALLAVVLLVIIIGALIWAVPNQTEFCDGRADGTYCKTLSSLVECASGYGSGSESICSKSSGTLQQLCTQCADTYATCIINACPASNDTDLP